MDTVTIKSRVIGTTLYIKHCYAYYVCVCNRTSFKGLAKTLRRGWTHQAPIFYSYYSIVYVWVEGAGRYESEECNIIICKSTRS
jgi:hypothetical protein